MNLRLMTGRIVASVMTISIGSTASAHPGHGVTPAADSAAHYLFEPAHGLAAVVLLLLAIVTTAQLLKSRSRSGKRGQVSFVQSTRRASSSQKRPDPFSPF